MNKIKLRLTRPIIILQAFLIILSSIALVLIIVEGSHMDWDISAVGFKTYLSLYQPFSILFSATFIVIATNLAIERLGIMTDANVNTFRAGNRTLWIQTVKEFLPDIKDTDPQIVKEILRNILFIHDHLFQKNYRISDKASLDEFYNAFFKGKVQWFEYYNKEYMSIAFYRSADHSYTFTNFRYIIAAMLDDKNCYAGFSGDLEKLYMDEVAQFNADNIDKVAYELTIQERVRNRWNVKPN